MKKVLMILVICLLCISCADKAEVIQVVETHQYGFWGGLWHGIIAPFDFIGSLIWDDVTVYAQNNNGGWYAFGFVLGVGGFSSSAHQGVKSRK